MSGEQSNYKKEKWYLKKWCRTGGILLWIVLFMVWTGCIGATLWLASRSELYVRDIFDVGKDTYEETSSFAGNMIADGHTAISSVQRQKGREELQALGKKGLIDLRAYYSSGSYEITDQKGLAYSLTDLENWGELREPDQDILVMRSLTGKFRYYWMSEFEERVRTGKLRTETLDADSQSEDWDKKGDALLEHILSGASAQTEESDALYESADGREVLYDEETKTSYSSWWIYQGACIRESAPPNGYRDLLDMANTDMEWNGHLQDAYNMLTNGIQGIQLELPEYDMSYLEEGRTNLVYIYAKGYRDGKAKEIFTNRKAYEDPGRLDQSVTQLKNSGKYVLCKGNSQEVEDNVNTAYLGSILSLQSCLSEDDLFIVGVDVSYKVTDSYSIDSRNFEAVHQYLQPLSRTVVVIGLLLIALLVILTLGAGRVNTAAGVQLNAFDRWKTEPAALTVLLPAALLLAVTVNFGAGYLYDMFFRNSDMENVYVIVLSALCGCLASSFFLWGYLSLVRRIKARTLWSNSLLCMVCRGIAVLWKNMALLWRYLLVYAGMLLLNWIAMLSGAWVFLLLMAAADIGVLVWSVSRLVGRKKITEGLTRITDGEIGYQIPTETLNGDLLREAEKINHIGDTIEKALEKSMKDERMKTELITNVSHDLKTPLTSIINYIELIRREQPQDETIRAYLDVLDKKAQQLKRLTEDVVEASKASSGAVELHVTRLDIVEMIQQAIGEFQEKMQERQLSLQWRQPEEAMCITADGQKTWRILENLFENVRKYALEGTRVYVDTSCSGNYVSVTIKNISSEPLNISAEELTERFVRGDAARTSEGSGLGLSIARSLASLQGGSLELQVDGDLFKATLMLPAAL